MRTRPDITTRLEFPDGAVFVDEADFLVDPASWTKAFASHAAAQENIELGPDHWDVINFMRAYLDDHGIAADARFVLKFLSVTRSVDKIGAKKLLFEMFPYGYVKQACKIAGMKQPRAWSTG